MNHRSIAQTLSQDILMLLKFDTQLEDKHREKTGAYYTPVEMALQMSEDALRCALVRGSYDVNSVDQFLSGTLDPKTAQDVLEHIVSLTWLDMACGSGVFALSYLKLIEHLCYLYGMNSETVLQRTSHHMHVNDLHAPALEVFNQLLSLAFKFPLYLHSTHLDALIDLHQDPNHRRVMHSGGFDIIIGNPPYLGERGNKALFQQLRQQEHLKQYYDGKMDLFYFFIYLGVSWLSQRGVITQITTHYFTTADGAMALRRFMKERLDFRILHPLNTSSMFEDVHKLCFLSFSATLKETQSPPYLLRLSESSDYLDQSMAFDNHGQLQLQGPHRWQALLSELEKRLPTELNTLFDVNQGIVSGADRDKVMKGPVFVFEEHELPENFPKNLFKPFVKNSHIKPFNLLRNQKKWLLYNRKDEVLAYPEWLDHLSQFKESLSLRREVQNGMKPWHVLQWPRNPDIFESPKLVVPQRAFIPSFAFVEEPIYGSADVYFLSSAWMTNRDLMAYCAYLNSAYVYLWLFYRGKRKGDLLELYATPLKRIPIPQFEEEDLSQLSTFYKRCSEDLELQPRKDLHDWLGAYLKLDQVWVDELWAYYGEKCTDTK
jgi:adenine-specific DNA-methyltransferase